MNLTTITDSIKTVSKTASKTLFQLFDGPTSRKVSRFTEIAPGLVHESTYHVSKNMSSQELKHVAKVLTEKCGFTQKATGILLGKAQSTISTWLKK